ncbi:MAG: hypothetical protein OQK50_00895 [Deltaproteobacteria bacterium]|jgi:thioredoxin 1|nr:hypothetical protein [Deltaproteobacteria bacterium]MCW9048869.1 hypothetical protein [Deltaproteobacteria bacterium]
MIIAALVLFGCSQDQPAQQATTTVPIATEQANSANKAPEVADHLLVFFLDPNGGPCQMQDKILKQMTTELDGKVLIRPVQTTVPADRDLFYAYGIRALPTILLADSSGKEIKRLPPGVQTVETVRGLLGQITVN